MAHKGGGSTPPQPSACHPTATPLSSRHPEVDPTRTQQFSPISAAIQVSSVYSRWGHGGSSGGATPASARPCDATRVLASPTFLVLNIDASLRWRQAAAHSKSRLMSLAEQPQRLYADVLGLKDFLHTSPTLQPSLQS